MKSISNTFDKKKNRCCFNGTRKRSDSDRFYILIVITLVLLSIVSISGCGSEFEILFDKESPVIYWSEISGTINSINSDRSGRRTIFTTSNTPLDVDIDTNGNRIYWVESENPTEYHIKRVGFDGSGVTVVHTYSTGSNGSGPTSIAIDNSNGTIFWNQYGSANDLWKSVISAGTLSPVKWINTVSNHYTYSICVDTINRKMYFTSNEYYNIGTPLGSSNKGNPSIGELDISDIFEEKPEYPGPSSPWVPYKGITVDGNGGYVYYSLNTFDTPRCVRRRNLALNNPVTWIPASGFGIQKIALDLVNRKIYWTSESPYRIYRADLDSQNSNVEVFLQLDSKPTGIAIPR